MILKIKQIIFETIFKLDNKFASFLVILIDEKVEFLCFPDELKSLNQKEAECVKNC